MEKLSEKALALLERANSDAEFAQLLLNHPDQLLNAYSLDATERKFLSALNSADDIRREYESARDTAESSQRRLAYLYSIFGMSVVVAIVALIYLFLNLFLRNVLEGLGIPVWDNVPFFWRPIITTFVAISFGAVIYTLTRILASWSDTARTGILIAAILFVLIIGSVLVPTLPREVQAVVPQIVLILMFTILPASLYSLFIATKGKTLWEEFEQNLARLDPVTHQNVISIYRKKFVALYGPIDQSGFSSTLLQGEASFPIILATAIIATGWIWFYPKFGEQLQGFVGLVTPFTFGFLGAYIFSLHMLFRRYVQSDLKSVAYTHVSQRILTTWIWAYVLDALPWQNLVGDQRLAVVSTLAFAVGIFPDIAWQVIRKFLQRVLAIKLDSFQEEHPLSEIEGITIWTEARLLEEDIENVENLVTANIVDLMLRTNLKPQRIIDWIDQGILQMHLGSNKESELYKALRAHGILTATDLIFGYKLFTNRARERAGEAKKFFISEGLDPQVETLSVAIEDDPNMYHVNAWRGIRTELIAKLPNAIEAEIEREAPVAVPIEKLSTIPTPAPAIVSSALTAADAQKEKESPSAESLQGPSTETPTKNVVAVSVSSP